MNCCIDIKNAYQIYKVYNLESPRIFGISPDDPMTIGRHPFVPSLRGTKQSFLTAQKILWRAGHRRFSVAK